MGREDQSVDGYSGRSRELNGPRCLGSQLHIHERSSGWVNWRFVDDRNMAETVN